ncbi:uncharacterized protein LOC120785396 isoform X2 [Xiphias gladius]|uniref:uncharacterized protein LOC120785396 isoform X2 n=1 Tax=Xiphias gladius TaxID=8245 RepID=UPI001A98B896|nr:uncharacterized protein LOC120785396 isoform X2 [Xiphias gladius]
MSRTGQGGGAAGRKLYLKTRELLKPAKSCWRRRRRGTVWEFSQSGDMLPHSKGGGGGNTQHGRRRTMHQFKQESLPVSRAHRATAKSTSVSFSSTPMQFYNIHTLLDSGPILQPSPSPVLLSSAASYMPPASSLLHTTSLPNSAPPPHEDQPEHIDRLLEEVMMGLDILPNNNNNSNSGAPHCQPPLPPSSSSCTCASSGNNLAQNKQKSCTTGLLEAGPGFHRSTQVVAVARGASGSTSANHEIPNLQQQGEGELNKMLDRFLQSFEQHIDSFSAREEEDMVGDSSAEARKPYTVQSKYRKTKTQIITAHSPHLQNTRIFHPVIDSQTTELRLIDKAETLPSRSQPHSAVPPKHAEGTPGRVEAPAKQPNKRRKKKYLSSLEKKRVRVRNPVSTSDREDKQLQQMPVVKLERSGPLPVRVTLQGHNCQSLEVKDSLLSLEEPLVDKRSPSAGQPGSRRGRTKKNRQLLSLSNGGTTPPPTQLQHVEPCGTNEQLEKNQEGHEKGLTVQPQEEAEGPTGRGKKRGAESREETSDEATVAKRVCFGQMAQPTSETCIPSSESADFVSEQATTETEDEIDVETLSLTSEGDRLQREEREEKTLRNEIILEETEESLMDEEMQGSGDEIIDVDGDTDGRKDLEKHTDDYREEDRFQSRTAPSLLHFVSPPSHSEKGASVDSTGSWEEEDIDVIGGSSPVPDPVVISWTESSEGEEQEGDEDVDVVGEKKDYTSSVINATINKGELVNRKCQTEVLLH